MTPSKEMQQAMNDQIRKEFESASVYLSMSAFMETENLPGFAAWLRRQAREESGHALKIFDHLLDRGARVVLQGLAEPPTIFKSPLDVFEQVKKHEVGVTKSIHHLYGLAVQAKDYPSQVFLGWFVTEQVEEEHTSTNLVESLRMIGDNRSALLLLDRELGARGGSEGGEDE
jgi:ferritin